MDNRFMEKLFLHIGQVLAEINSEGYIVIEKYIKPNDNKENESKCRIESNITINPSDKDVVYQYFYKGLDIMQQGAEPLYLQTEMEYELHRITLRADIDDLTLRALHLVKRILIDFHEGKCDGEFLASFSRYYTSSKIRNKLTTMFLESGFIIEDELTKIYKEECEISEELNIEELEKSNKKLIVTTSDESVKEYIDRNIEGSRLLIAVYNEVIIGVIAFNEKKKLFKTKEGTKEILDYEINDMTIDKSYEGKGIAKYLIWGVYDKLDEVCGNVVRFNIIEPGVTSMIRMKLD